jgi:DNA-binding response OmpR family regulator
MKILLVVDDDSQLRASLAAALSEEYTVQTAGDGIAAIDYVRKNPVDVMLLDIMMPDGDGYMVLSRIAGLKRRPRIVVLTGMSDPAKAVKAMRLGADDYLVKPCDLDTIRAALRSAVSSPAQAYAMA